MTETPQTASEWINTAIKNSETDMLEAADPLNVLPQAVMSRNVSFSPLNIWMQNTDVLSELHNADDPQQEFCNLMEELMSEMLENPRDADCLSEDNWNANYRSEADWFGNGVHLRLEVGAIMNDSISGWFAEKLVADEYDNLVADKRVSKITGYDKPDQEHGIDLIDTETEETWQVKTSREQARKFAKTEKAENVDYIVYVENNQIHKF